MTLSAAFYIPNGDLDAAKTIISQFETNNSDIDFGDTNLSIIPSFYRYFGVVLEPINLSGFIVLLSSRLIPESIILNEPDEVAEIFVQAKSQSMAGSNLLGNLVTGGQISNTSNTNNSINPG
ncbi:unnamed protein product [Rotaria sp. Silwood2]|nr:unnamed protein product [Rotaria sp. Silwood2]